MTRHEEVEKYGLNTIDKKHLLAHLSGEKITPMQAIHSKCYECCGYFADGKADCGISDCPLYSFMRYNPHRIKVKRILTDEQHTELRERFKRTPKQIKKR